MARQSFLSALAAGVVAVAGSVSSGGTIFVTTGHTGSQVQLDTNHTQHWTYTVSADISGVSGGLFSMKRGPKSSAPIYFSIFAGTFENFVTAAPLLSVTADPSQFTQSYAPVLLEGAEFDLVAGTTYTAVLRSAAVDAQNEAYFIKGGSEAPLFLADRNGNPVTTGGQITTPYTPPPIDAVVAPISPPGAVVPIPAAAPAGLVLLAAYAVVGRLRRPQAA